MKEIMFEILKCSEVKHQQNSHNFTVGHLVGANTMVFTVTF